jgi:cyanoexosortase A
MSAADGPAHSARQRWSLGAAIAVAACQIALGWRLGADDYWVTMTAAWIAALYLARQGPQTTIATAGVGAGVLGAVMAVAAIVALGAAPGYRALDRVLPLAAGAGIALAASGPSGWLAYRRELLLLALPLIHPVPRGVRSLVDPVLLPWTTWCAAALDRATGHPIAADGNVLVMPHEMLRVVSACSGLFSISRLWVLAALIVALFTTTARQKVALVMSAVFIGFVINAVRIAVLGVAVTRAETGTFDYWHEGPGATFFTLASTGAAGLTWWLLLRRRGPLTSPTCTPAERTPA